MDLSNETLATVKEGDLKTEDLRNETIGTISSVDYLREPISYDEFFRKYLLPNRLCILGPWATENWRSCKEWVKDDGSPDLAFLKQKFGHVTCPVANCKKEQYSAHPKSEMMVSEFIDYLEKYTRDNYPHERDCFYLKDWHLQRLFPEYDAYSVPPYFKSDWMNEFWDAREDSDDDYRFVYIGPKGSWTPFHSDVFRSYSWSANICGRKKWIFFPPGEEKNLKDVHGQLAFDLNSPELDDRSRFPEADRVKKKFEVFQEQGEVVFVPSGWHHQVFNIENTISINHNWMNGCNVDLCWRHLADSLVEVQKEIQDCRDMDGWGAQCQLILKASAGMDYAEFYRYILVIAQKRMESLQRHLDNRTECDTIKNNIINHYVFDLITIKELVFEMKRNKQFLEIDFEQFNIKPKKLTTTIAECVEKFV